MSCQLVDVCGCVCGVVMFGVVDVGVKLGFTVVCVTDVSECVLAVLTEFDYQVCDIYHCFLHLACLAVFFMCGCILLGGGFDDVVVIMLCFALCCCCQEFVLI